MSLILNKLFYNLIRTTENQLLETDVKNIERVNPLPDSEKFRYLFIVFIIFFIFTKVISKIGLNQIFALIISIFAIYYFMQNYKTELSNSSHFRAQQLNFLDEILLQSDYTNTGTIGDIDPHYDESYLNLEPKYIDFFYRTREYFRYSSKQYRDALRAINEFIRLKKEIKEGIYYRKLQLDINVLEDARIKALNHFKSIIFTYPPARYTLDKVYNDTKVLHKLLTHDIKKVYEMYRKEYLAPDKINIYTSSTYDMNVDLPKPNDTESFGYIPNFNSY